VNDSFFDVVSQHPLGRGTGRRRHEHSVLPARGSRRRTIIENEYARISLEQGLPGLVIWILFILWVLTRRPGRVKDEWLLSRRLIWVASASIFSSGMLGMGMLAAVPQTVLMLLLIGWTTTARLPVVAVPDTGEAEPAA
jgi:hypothetical protein